jgi:hypothetical protein
MVLDLRIEDLRRVVASVDRQLFESENLLE